MVSSLQLPSVKQLECQESDHTDSFLLCVLRLKSLCCSGQLWGMGVQVTARGL